MIKPEDIMLGDLVYNHRQWICPVTAIAKDHVEVVAKYYGVQPYIWDDMYPIPLTEDIILQLGWEEITPDNPKHKIRIGLGKQFKHPDYTDVLNINQNSLTDMYWTLNGEICIKYLHDLQHVLHHTVKDTIIVDGDKLSIENYRFWEHEE